jgi:putative peptidoglycan lipid II flippase
VGLALATSIGAWINFALVLFWAARANYVGADAELRSALIKLCGAGLAMALLLFLAAPPISHAVASLPRFRNETELVVLAALGALVYGGLVIALLGQRLRSFVRRRGVVKTGAPPTEA